MPTTRTKPAGPGRPKDLEKRQAILEAAKRLFPRHGYDGISMDAIAAEAGVSKLTVYSHFSDKETLFAEAVKAVCEEQLPHGMFELRPDNGPIDQVLLTIARRFHALVSSEDSIRLHRIMAAQAPDSPKLAQLFYEAGPRRTLADFEALLRQADAAGTLAVPDPARAAGHFFCLIKGLSHMRTLLGCCPPPTVEDTEAHLRSVVGLFVRAHAPDGNAADATLPRDRASEERPRRRSR